MLMREGKSQPRVSVSVVGADLIHPQGKPVGV